jgi:two-component system cell cycle sensor histidine kinase/response regulator CckA
MTTSFRATGREQEMEAPNAAVTTILILDDNPTVLQMLGLVLRASGAYRILEASTEQQAVAHFEQGNGAIDMLVADVCIDDRPGRAIAERLMTLCPGLRVLFISGYTKEHLVGNGWLEPNDAFLAKPFVPVRLLRQVEEVLGKAHVTPVASATTEQTACAGGQSGVW